MTRFIFFVLTVFFLFFTYPFNALANEPLVVFRPGSALYTIGEQNYQMDRETLLINDRLYVPLRFFAIGIGSDKRNFIWNEDASKVALINGNDLIIIDRQSGTVYINGRLVKMSLKPVEIDGRLYVPLRHFAEMLDYEVAWDELNKRVSVMAGKLPEKEIRKGKLRHEFAVGGSRFTPGESTLAQWQIALLQKNIYLTIQSVEQMSSKLSNPGETLLCYEKMLGDALIELPGDPEQAANNQNAITALHHLTGVELKQGEIFSFNNTSGPYGRERGYITGFSFSGDKVIREMGGGVCRTSTLVYNAVLDAGLPVIERHRHSLPVYYVPQNKDAAVGYGVLDFRFKNNRECPLFFRTEGNSERICLSIWEKHQECRSY